MRVLQPEVLRYDRSFNYHYLLGAVCLHAGDFGGALTYLRIAHELKHRDAQAILGLAALFLRRGDVSRAVDLYLEVLELDPKNRIAKRALRIIRKQAGTEAFSVWLEARLSSLYPQIPFPGFSTREKVTSLCAMLAAFVIGFGVVVFMGLAPNPFRARGGRAIPYGLTLTWYDRTAPVGDGDYRHLLTQRQALDIYDRALALFSDHRDEAARIHLNRILESNAAEGLRNRAQLMLSLLETPGFDTFRRDDNVSHAQAWQDPSLYQGVHVIWRGIASNVSIADGETTFDFLLGYNAPRIVEGIVPVVFGHAIPMPGDPLEVLGRIVPVENDGRLRLEGIAIRTNL